MRRTLDNHYVEKIQFLPDEIELYVSRVWCCHVVTCLNIMEMHRELLNMVSELVSPQSQYKTSVLGVPRFVKMSVGNIKKLVNICGDNNLCCCFPCNYDELANKFIEDKLGATKIEIELLMADDKIDETFQFIDSIKDEYQRKLSLLYMKFIHDSKTQNIIEDIKKARKKTVNKIYDKLC